LSSCPRELVLAVSKLGDPDFGNAVALAWISIGLGGEAPRVGPAPLLFSLSGLVEQVMAVADVP
jgi:hypothetical protein